MLEGLAGDIGCGGRRDGLAFVDGLGVDHGGTVFGVEGHDVEDHVVDFVHGVKGLAGVDGRSEVEGFGAALGFGPVLEGLAGDFRSGSGRCEVALGNRLGVDNGGTVFIEEGDEVEDHVALIFEHGHEFGIFGDGIGRDVDIGAVHLPLGKLLAARDGRVDRIGVGLGGEVVFFNVLRAHGRTVDNEGDGEGLGGGRFIHGVQTLVADDGRGKVERRCAVFFFRPVLEGLAGLVGRGGGGNRRAVLDVFGLVNLGRAVFVVEGHGVLIGFVHGVQALIGGDGGGEVERLGAVFFFRPVLEGLEFLIGRGGGGDGRAVLDVFGLADLGHAVFVVEGHGVLIGFVHGIQGLIRGDGSGEVEGFAAGGLGPVLEGLAYNYQSGGGGDGIALRHFHFGKRGAVVLQEGDGELGNGFVNKLRNEGGVGLDLVGLDVNDRVVDGPAGEFLTGRRGGIGRLGRELAVLDGLRGAVIDAVHGKLDGEGVGLEHGMQDGRVVDRRVEVIFFTGFVCPMLEVLAFGRGRIGGGLFNGRAFLNGDDHVVGGIIGILKGDVHVEERVQVGLLGDQGVEIERIVVFLIGGPALEGVAVLFGLGGNGDLVVSGHSLGGGGAVDVVEDNVIVGGSMTTAATTAAGITGRNGRSLQISSRRVFGDVGLGIGRGAERRFIGVVVEVDRAVVIVNDDAVADGGGLEGHFAFAAAGENASVDGNAGDVEVTDAHAVGDDDVTVDADALEMDVLGSDHHAAGGNAGIVTGIADVEFEDVVEDLRELFTGDVVLRTDGAVFITVDVAAADKADDGVGCPIADGGVVGELC